MQFSSRLH